MIPEVREAMERYRQWLTYGPDDELMTTVTSMLNLDNECLRRTPKSLHALRRLAERKITHADRNNPGAATAAKRAGRQMDAHAVNIEQAGARCRILGDKREVVLRLRQR